MLPRKSRRVYLLILSLGVSLSSCSHLKKKGEYRYQSYRGSLRVVDNRLGKSIRVRTVISIQSPTKFHIQILGPLMISIGKAVSDGKKVLIQSDLDRKYFVIDHGELKRSLKRKNNGKSRQWAYLLDLVSASSVLPPPWICSQGVCELKNSQYALSYQRKSLKQRGKWLKIINYKSPKVDVRAQLKNEKDFYKKKPIEVILPRGYKKNEFTF